MKDDQVQAAAVLLGCKATEIEDITDGPDGHQVIKTTDGVAYIVVDDEVQYLSQPEGVVVPAIPVFDQPQADEPTRSHVLAEGSGNGGPIPDKVDEVLEWVGDDTERAQYALDHELAGKARVTLIEALEDKLSGGKE